MAFGTKSFTVKAGQPVKLTFSNKAAVPLPHNVIVGKPGTKDALFAVAAKLMTDPAGMTKGFIPESTTYFVLSGHLKHFVLFVSETF